jgi:hypothetical protein
MDQLLITADFDVKGLNKNTAESIVLSYKSDYKIPTFSTRVRISEILRLVSTFGVHSVK